MSLLPLLPRLLAYAAGRAARCASHRQVAIRPEALVLCPLGMHGEEASIHIVALGGLGERPRFLWVPDPRDRDSEAGILRSLGEELERRFTAAREAGTYPQLWVPAAPAVALLDVLSERLRFQRDPGLRRLGELLAYPAERYPVAGQQALHTATGALTRHWATGQQPGEDEHLGALLTWIQPPEGEEIYAAVERAEREPRGTRTDPAFDREVLEPLLSAYTRARQAGGTGEGEAARIGAALRPLAETIYRDTQRALRLLLLGLDLPPLPDLGALERREAEEFQRFMAARDAGYPLPLRDGPRGAAFRLAEREAAEENWQAARLGDRLARAGARLAGELLVGQVVNPRKVGSGRGREYLMELESRQAVLRVRRRDELVSADDPRLRVVVEEVRRDDGVTRVVLRITRGQRAVGLPGEGSTLELTRSVPDWEKLPRLRRQLRARLSETPWTHDPALPPPACPALPGPRDPLAAVEALR